MNKKHQTQRDLWMTQKSGYCRTFMQRIAFLGVLSLSNVFFTGCATIPKGEDPFLTTPFVMPPTINMLDNDIVPVVSDCQISLLEQDGIQLEGTLLVDNNLISPADQNGFRDSATITYDRPTTQLEPVQIRIIDSRSCSIVHAIDLDSADTAVWDGRANGSILIHGAYIAQLISTDSRLTGDLLPLFIAEADDDCDVSTSQIEWVFEGTVSGSDDGKSVIIDRLGAVHLCVEARTAQGNRVPPDILVNGATYVSQALTQAHSAVAFGADSFAREHKVTVANLSGNVDLRVGVLPVQFPHVERLGDDSDLEYIPPPDCVGRLYGFEHPFRADLPPYIEREGVLVRCVRRYKIERGTYVTDPQTGQAVESTSSQIVDATETGLTDEQGRFEITIPASAYIRIGVAIRRPTTQRAAICVDQEQCGRETRSAIVAADTPNEYMGLFNVPDIAINGLVARLVTNGDRRNSDLPELGELTTFEDFNRFSGLVDSGKGSLGGVSAPNDLPIVVHEAFDPLLEDGTNQLAWFLNGQIVDHQRLDNSGLSNSPCEQPMRGPCLGCKWNFNCDEYRVAAQNNPSLVANQRFRCHAPNVLLQFVANGYDVWLVDSVRHDASVYDIAAAALPLYQNILDFGEPDDDRRLALAGLSLGGVLSRVALRSWEVLNHRKLNGNDDPLRLGDRDTATTPRPQTLLHGPEKVSLFLSFDAPHLGALIPPAFQAYVKDKDFDGGPRFPSLLNSTPARELLKEFVLPNTNTVCWGEGDDLVKDCTIKHPLDTTTDLVAQLEPNGVQLQDRSIEFFSQLPPGNPDSPGFGTGLPRSIPSVSIANGSLTTNPPPVSDTVLDIDFDLISTEFRHQIKDAFQQPLGSGLSTYCSAKELESESKLVSLTELLYADCRDNTAGILGRYINRFFCGVGALIGTLQSRGLAALIEAGISPNIEIPMRPRADGTGHYPTFVETSSALLVRPRLQLQNVPWLDYSTRPVSKSHFNIDEEQCRFVMYHLDGQMKGDGDGWPACTGRAANSCLEGGRQPGERIDNRGQWIDAPDTFCDPNDFDDEIIPIAPLLEQIRERNSIVR